MKSLFYFPPQFKDRIFEAHGDKGLAWLQALPDLIKEYERRWDVRFLRPVANLSYAYVAIVEHAGKQAILKMNPDSGVISKEVHWLRGYSELTPKILEDASAEGVFLMDKIEPGLALKDRVIAGDDDLATHIICEMVKRLQANPIRSNEFPHLSEQNQISLLRGRIDKHLLEKAETLFAELTVKSSQDVLLHGDLHHDNIISDGATGWKVIDPHGYVGDPASEISPFIFNPLDVLPEWENLELVLQRRINIMTAEMPFDPLRIKSWAFCRTMLSMAWTFEGTGEVPKFESRVARFLSSLV